MAKFFEMAQTIPEQRLDRLKDETRRMETLDI
jgi:hypothetical protein